MITTAVGSPEGLPYCGESARTAHLTADLTAYLPSTCTSVGTRVFHFSVPPSQQDTVTEY